MSPKLMIWLFLSILIVSSKTSARRRYSYRSRAKDKSWPNLTGTPGQCNKRPLLMTRTYGTIRSPGYPRAYANKQRCTWQISVPKGFRIRLKFRRQFGIELSLGCSKDYVIVAQSKSFRNPLTFCGRNRPNVIFSPKNNLWIRFQSDNARTDKGFLASYQAIDDNECDRQVCTFPSLCRNTVGSYTCDCPDGYENRGRRSSTKCVDIDECKSGAARCDHLCQNTDGSYFCQCRPGYQLAPDGRRCKADVNECRKSNGGCSHFCKNTRSSYRCQCPKGYTLHTDKKTCFPAITFTSNQYMTSIKENSRPGVQIITIKAKSFAMLISGPIQYKLVSENLLPPSKFSIDKNSGIIRVIGALDREKTASYLLEVFAGSYHGNGSLGIGSKTYVIVNVLDENDNVPQFDRASLSIKIPCNFTVGKNVYRMNAKDKDAGDNGKIKYKLSTKNSFFSILPNTGKIRLLKNLKRFCRLSPAKTFTLFITARDHGIVPNMAQAIVQLEVTPPGRSRTVSLMQARFYDVGQRSQDTITRRQAQNPRKLRRGK